MIQLSKIDKYYDSLFQRTFILKGVNLEVKQGEFVTIIQVTHNEKYANYGTRIIKLEDGLVRGDRLIDSANKDHTSVNK